MKSRMAPPFCQRFIVETGLIANPLLIFFSHKCNEVVCAAQDCSC